MPSINFEIIQRNWPLTNVVISTIKNQGKGGHVLKISSEEGEWICKITGSWKKPEDLNQNLKVLDFIQKNDAGLSPKLLKTKDGKKFAVVESDLVYITSYLGSQTPQLSTKNYFLLGQTLAKIHSLKNYKIKTQFTAKNIIHDLKQKAENYDFKNQLLDIINRFPSFDNCPQVLIHTDPALTNSILISDNNLTLIDWDESGLGESVLDIGAQLIQQFVTEDLVFLNIEAEALFAGYKSLRSLSLVEKDLIFWSAVLRACFYLPFGDVSKRWRRVLWAIENQNLLEGVYKRL